jgi:hypothetical protein
MLPSKSPITLTAAETGAAAVTQHKVTIAMHIPRTNVFKRLLLMFISKD